MKLAQMWGLGDYATVGDRWAAAGVSLVEQVVRPGDRLLDVACGAGVVAIAAAQAGAQASGLDVAPSLLDGARRRAQAAGVSVRWIEADMTSMPEPDGGYDLVLSAFGAMFAADPAAMAAELVRVCTDDGLVGVLAWTPESPFGSLRPIFARYLPPFMTGPPVEAWGDPEQVQKFFAGLPVTVQTDVATVQVRWPSLDAAMHEVTTLVPGVVAARMSLEPAGSWPRARAEVSDLFAIAGQVTDDGFVLPVPYLMTLARRH
jgi:SAM-dependent methyltransferase